MNIYLWMLMVLAGVVCLHYEQQRADTLQQKVISQQVQIVKLQQDRAVLRDALRRK